MLRYMLDTNIAIYIIKRRPPEALAQFNRATGRMCTSTVTPAELMHGVEKSARPEHNLKQVEDFVSRLEVVDYDARVAAHYGEIRNDLERKDMTLGVNDLHIAGHARSAGLILVTNNLKEFERVNGLRVESRL